jgi:hypothetical protein
LGSDVNNCTVIHRRLQQQLVLLLLLFLVRPGASAGAVALYGIDYIELDEALVATGPDGAEQTRRLSDAGDYDLQLEQLETEAGPYADGLSVPLASLARYFLVQGVFSQALASYRRAIHIVRINEGLYHPRQIPLVRSLLDVYRVSGDMAGLDDSYEYFFRLYGSAQPPYTDIRMRATVEYLRWQREAIALGLDDTPGRRLQAAYALNQDVLEAVGASVAVSYSWYRDLVISQLRNLYLVQAQIPDNPDRYNISPFAPAPSMQPQMMDFDQQRLANLRRNSFAKGRLLLDQLIHRAGLTKDSVAVAAAYLEAGDWYHFNGSRRSAVNAYSSVILTLEGSGNQQMLSDWFDQPVALPAAMPGRRPGSSETERPMALAANYEVDSRGYANNIEVFAADSDQKSEAGKLRRLLSATRFRPRYAAGSAVSSEGVERSYQLLLR